MSYIKLSDPEPVDTLDKETEIYPQVTAGFVHLYSDSAIVYPEFKLYDYDYVKEVYKNGMEHGGLTIVIVTANTKAFPPSITIAKKALKVPRLSLAIEMVLQAAELAAIVHPVYVISVLELPSNL